MERITSTSQFRWGHEPTPGMKMVEPDPSVLVPYIDAEGNTVNDEETGELVKVPPPDFQPEFEQITLDTVVIIDQEAGEIFKFALDNTGLARFISYYIQFLNAESRQAVREVLGQTSDVVPATLGDLRKLELVKG